MNSKFLSKFVTEKESKPITKEKILLDNLIIESNNEKNEMSNVSESISYRQNQKLIKHQSKTSSDNVRICK